MKETTIAVVRLCEVCGERATPTTRGTVVDWLAYCDAHRPTGKSDAAPAAGCAVGSIDTGRIGRERRQKESLTMDYDKAGYLAELLAEQFSAVLELREDLAALRAAAQQHIEEQRNRADAAERKAAELQRELKELEAFTHDRMSEITRLCKERDAVAAEAAQTERLAREEIKRLRAERDEAQNLAAQMERLAREAQAEVAALQAATRPAVGAGGCRGHRLCV